MTRRRKLLYVIGGLLLVLVALFLWAYRGTRVTLRAAEAFQFRRMLVSQVGKEGADRFFFVSNRRLEPGEASLEERFGNERQAQLELGFFDTAIEPSVGLGMFLNASDWFRDEEIRIRDVQRLERPEFVERLHDMVERSPHRSLMVIVHGFREAFDSALRKTAFVSHVLDIDTPILLFDWPGNQGSSLRGYRRAREVAQESGAELARTLDLVSRDVEPARLWLLANSMGGEVVTEAFGRLYRDAEWADVETEIEDVVLTAPDVGHQDFGERFEEEIASLTRDLTVYVSSNDRALLMSRVVNRQRRLGESTLTTLSRDQLEEALAISRLIDPHSDRVTLVDVTPVNRTRNFHNFSLETPEFFDDLFLRLTNPITPRNRLLYTAQTPDGVVYWILTRGR